MPDELHPNGRSFITIERNGQLLESIDATNAPSGIQATHAIYPLHSGKTGQGWYKVLVTLSGILPLAFFITGLIPWLKRRCRMQHQQSVSL